ncbi:MAG TPA: hypothetical protein PKY44_06995 [Bacteroidales bacterium]|nr:hypothetical protein [Bacteroidales bacterium]
MKKFILLLLALILLSQSINAQNIGISDVAITPDASSMLEVRSTNKGLLIPRVALTDTTSASPITSPATSLLVYNTATAGTAPNNVTPGYYYWTGSKWMRLLAIDDKVAWLLTGNSGTDTATNFLGTTDAQPLVIRTNNTERSRILSNGQVLINRTTAYYSDGLLEVQGNSTYPFAINGLTNQASGAGVYGYNSASSGTGVIGVGNNESTVYTYTGGSGGAFTGNKVGSYNIFTSTSAGTEYVAFGGVGVFGTGPNTNFGSATQAYRYGVYGVFPDANNNSCRSAGVLGYFNDSEMGALAYVNKSGTVYGLLYVGGAANAGKSLSNSYTRPSTQVTGIGAGGWGGVLGSFTRGAVMGSIFAAPDFATYNLGNEYTSGLQANIHTLDEKRVATYSITSQDVKIYADGIGKLINGTCKIQFSDDFINLISDESMPIVTVTPLGPSKGLYIAKISSDGFIVVENDGGKSNIDFTWIAIGVQKGYEQAPTLPESVARIDFDEKMMKVMTPENSNEESLPLWYDGQKIRFDNHPIIYSNRPEQLMLKVKKSESTIQKSLDINNKTNIH